MPDRDSAAPDSGTLMVDMEVLLGQQAEDPLTITQISGPGSPRSFRVLPLQKVTLGRDKTCEVVLKDSSVSREHAIIDYTHRRPQLVDCGSTNGTYVAGNPIKSIHLKGGETIQIGEISFEVEIGSTQTDVTSLTGSGRKSAARMRKIRDSMSRGASEGAEGVTQKIVFQGRLKEVNLPSLLQVLESNQDTGTILIRKGTLIGAIFLDQVGLVHATFGVTRGPKALYRLLALKDGTFEFIIPGRAPEERSIKDSLQHHLLEAARELDEIPLYRDHLPPEDTVLIIEPATVTRLATMSADVFDVLAAVKRHRTLGTVIDRCQVTDLSVCRILFTLFKEGILTAEDQATGNGPARGAVEDLEKTRAYEALTDPDGG